MIPKAPLRYVPTLLLLMFVNVRAALAQSVPESQRIAPEYMPPDGAVGNHFGAAVALDGQLAAIGIPYYDLGFYKTGAVAVYQLADGLWQRQAMLKPSQGFESSFGHAVDMDANKILVGAYADGENGQFSGAAYIYELDGSTWNETKLVAPDGSPEDYFGYSVATGGNVAAVGAFRDDEREEDAGAVYIYGQSGASWLASKITAPDGGKGDRFGQALATNGTKLLVGAPGCDQSGIDAGAVYLYQMLGAEWVFVHKILPPDGGSGAHFGCSLAIDGDTFAIGASGQQVNGTIAGAAYLYHWGDSLWLDTLFAASDIQARQQFACSLDLKGGKLLVGAKNTQVSGDAAAGAAYLYEQFGGQWSETKLLPTASASGTYFGNAVAIGDSSLLVGEDASQGAAHFFSLGDSLSMQQQKVEENHAGFQHFGSAIALGDTLVVIGAIGDDDNGQYGGAAYVYSLNDAAWSTQARLAVPDGDAFDLFGISVAVDGNKILVGAENSSQSGHAAGAAYLFDWRDTLWQPLPITAPGIKTGDAFGKAVAIGQGRLAVGAPKALDGKGAVYVCWQQGSALSQPDLLSVVNGSANDNFGCSLSFWEDRLAVGANQANNKQGAVYIFQKLDSLWQSTELTDSVGGIGFMFGTSVDFFQNRVLVGSPNALNGGSRTGLAHVFEWDGELWRQSTLTPPDGVEGDTFGQAVALGHHRLMVGAPGKNGNTGAVYVYDWDGENWLFAHSLQASGASQGDFFGDALAMQNNHMLVGGFGVERNGTPRSGAAFHFLGDDCSNAITELCQEAACIFPSGNCDYRGGVSFVGKHTIAPDSVVGMTASNYLDFGVGFSVLPGASFSASIVACGTSGKAAGEELEEEPTLASQFENGQSGLGQNRPNPFGSLTQIPIHLPEAARSASLEIHDLAGRKVESIALPQRNSFTVDLKPNRQMRSGMYLYTLVVDGKNAATKRMAVMERP